MFKFMNLGVTTDESNDENIIFNKSKLANKTKSQQFMTVDIKNV
jgi:hypothetical protein